MWLIWLDMVEFFLKKMIKTSFLHFFYIKALVQNLKNRIDELSEHDKNNKNKEFDKNPKDNDFKQN